MRVYLAATEDIYRQRAQVKVQRLLLSFYGSEERLLHALHDCAPEDWCIDSGAHFFLGAHFKHDKRPPVADVEAHIVRYTDFLRRLPSKPAFAVEMDLQELYGIDLINEWREDIWAPFEEETGIPVLYAWHTMDGKHGFKDMVANPDIRLMGLSNLRATPVPQLTKLVSYAYHHGIPVHGFAAVRGRILKQVPFFSVDSTSWGSVSLFGVVRSFDPIKGVMKTGAAGRGVFKRDKKACAAAVIKAGRGKIHISDTLGVNAGGDLSRTYQFAADQYVSFEEWYNAYWKCKGVDWDAKLKAQAQTKAASVGSASPASSSPTG